MFHFVIFRFSRPRAAILFPASPPPICIVGKIKKFFQVALKPRHIFCMSPFSMAFICHLSFPTSGEVGGEAGNNIVGFTD